MMSQLTATDEAPQTTPERTSNHTPDTTRVLLALRPKKRVRRRWGVYCAVGWVLLIIVLAIVANLLPISDPTVQVAQPRLHPFVQWTPDTILGTDRNGRSILSRLIFGARASLTVSVLSVILGFFIGGAIGLIAGYVRGATDKGIGIVTDAALAFPALIAMLALAATMGPGIPTLIVGLTFVAVPQMVRIARANTIRFGGREFVQAAELMGASRFRILVRELLPNVVPTLFGYSVIVMATLIVTEAALSYLGVGIRPPAPSWGSMIADGQGELSRHPHQVLIPALTLLITVYSLNVIGDWARSKFDVGESRL